MVNPIDFGGHSSNVQVTMGNIDKFGVRGDATLCVVIFEIVILWIYYMASLLASASFGTFVTSLFNFLNYTQQKKRKRNAPLRLS